VRNRLLFITIAIVGLMSVAGAAVAAPPSHLSGGGQSPLNASYSVSAKPDLSGHLNYMSDDHTFRSRCSGFDSYAQSTTAAGYPRVEILGTCTDRDGNTVYMRGVFIDRGEPGRMDWLCLLWGYQQPVTQSNAVIHDMGTVDAGNIQIN
jgi:hypothetical protein